MIKKDIAILDYGIGNVRSICNAFEEIGAHPILTNEKKIIMNSSALVLPGVGAFAKGMKNLEENNLIDIIYDYVKSDRPFLGICLGMQMLLEESEEFGLTKGLGLIKGKVIKMPIISDDMVKLPHVSWNEIKEPSPGRWKNTILENTNNSADVYFVHSFVASPQNDKDILAVTNYSGFDFCAAVHFQNIFGTQFHPEKSGNDGLDILKKFVELAN